MNYWQYTFHGAFGKYAAIATMLTILLALVFYILTWWQALANTLALWALAVVLTLLISRMRYNQYQTMRNQRVSKWGTRL